MSPTCSLLRFSDEYSTVLDKAKISIGAPVKLLVQQSGPGGPAPLLSGEVTALETEMDHDGLYTIVRGLDHSHRLFRGRRVEAYLQSTAADIVRKVAGRAGIQAGTIDAKGPVLQHVGAGRHQRLGLPPQAGRRGRSGPFRLRRRAALHRVHGRSDSTAGGRRGEE
jgi:hypothetical protein